MTSNDHQHVARFWNKNPNGHGLYVQIQNPNHTQANNFITFANGDGTVGRIEGYTHTGFVIPGSLCEALGLGLTSPGDFALATASSACRDGGVIYESGNGDYAEWLERENPEDTMIFGQVVGVKGGKISFNTNDAEQLMIVSLAPIMLGAMQDSVSQKNFEKVAFMGQVPCWIYGGANTGDYILPSGDNNGIAIAVSPEDITIDQMELIVGRAWSDAEAKEDGKVNMINVVVGVRTPELAKLMKAKVSQLSDQHNLTKQEVDELKAENAKLDKRLNKIESILLLNAEANK